MKQYLINVMMIFESLLVWKKDHKRKLKPTAKQKYLHLTSQDSYLLEKCFEVQ